MPLCVLWHDITLCQRLNRFAFHQLTSPFYAYRDWKLCLCKNLTNPVLVSRVLILPRSPTAFCVYLLWENRLFQGNIIISVSSCVICLNSIWWLLTNLIKAFCKFWLSLSEMLGHTFSFLCLQCVLNIDNWLISLMNNFSEILLAK